MFELPVVRGVFLCENVIVEERSRNVSLINCFTRKLVDEFPSSPQRLVVYATFAKGLGTIPIELEVLDLDDGEVVYSRSVDITFTDPVQEMRFVYRVHDLILSQSGSHEVTLTSCSEPLGRTRFTAVTAGS